MTVVDDAYDIQITESIRRSAAHEIMTCLDSDQPKDKIADNRGTARSASAGGAARRRRLGAGGGR
jgi:hypothetical protein